MTLKDKMLMMKFKLLNLENLEMIKHPFYDIYWLYSDLTFDKLNIPKGLTVEKRLYGPNGVGCVEAEIFNSKSEKLGTLNLQEEKIKER